MKTIIKSHQQKAVTLFSIFKRDMWVALAAKRVSFIYVLVLLVLLGGVSCGVIIEAAVNGKRNETSNNPAATIAQAVTYTFPRLNGYSFVKPLLSAEASVEDRNLEPVKSDILAQINSYKASGMLHSCSFYLRDFKDESWLAVNEDEKYQPASLLKISIMITVLRQSEEKPGLLDEKILYNQRVDFDRVKKFGDDRLQLGKYYTIRELLEYMVAYSDNSAKQLLLSHFPVEAFVKTHRDLSLPIPSDNGVTEFTAREVSIMLSVLYNAGYLTIHDSEYACSLLAKSNFKEGMVAGLPQGIKLVHKFGEGGDVNGELQLHETGIIYMPGGPYLITIMTKGNDLQQLAAIIAALTKTTYNGLVRINDNHQTAM